MAKAKKTVTSLQTPPEPRSVRLTQAHRNDMVAAVMEEWEKQNPAPAQESNLEIVKLIVREIKKHPDYKRSQRMLKALTGDDASYLKTGDRIIVQFVNAQGEVRSTESGYLPLSLAQEMGLTSVNAKNTSYSGNRLMGVQVPEADVSPEYIENYRKEGNSYLFTTFNFVTASQMIVRLDDTAPVMNKIKALRKARKEWDQERYRLRTETTDLLAQFNTSKQLREGWPDMVPYLPPHVADPERAVRLPVLATSRLSERLGIKTP